MILASRQNWILNRIGSCRTEFMNGIGFCRSGQVENSGNFSVVRYNSSIRNFSSLLLDLGLEKSNLLLDLGRPYCWIRTRKVIIVISSLYNSFLLLGRETFLVLIVRLGAWKFLLLDLGLWDLSLSYRVFRHTILRLIYLFLWKFIM